MQLLNILSILDHLFSKNVLIRVCNVLWNLSTGLPCSAYCTVKFFFICSLSHKCCHTEFANSFLLSLWIARGSPKAHIYSSINFVATVVASLFGKVHALQHLVKPSWQVSKYFFPLDSGIGPTRSILITSPGNQGILGKCPPSFKVTFCFFTKQVEQLLVSLWIYAAIPGK